MYFPASTAAMNYASVELSAIVSWNRYLQRIAPPASLITIPVTDLRCVESPAQSESLAHIIHPWEYHSYFLSGLREPIAKYSFVLFFKGVLFIRFAPGVL